MDFRLECPSHRVRVVPPGRAPEQNIQWAHSECGVKPARARHSQIEESPAGPRSRNYTWAELMRRVFAMDVLECPRCRGRLRILAAITSPTALRAILECMGTGSGSRAPPVLSETPAEDLFAS